MKTSIKLAVPGYIVGISAIYISIILFVSHEFMAQSVGSDLDIKMSFLSIIVFSNTIWLEKMMNNNEIFILLSAQRVRYELIRRFFIKLLFLLLLFILCYFMCFMKNTEFIYVDENALTLFGKSLFSMTCSLFFWGNVTCRLVLLFQNVWAGILFSAFGWYLLNTNVASKLPVYLNIFSNSVTNDNGCMIQGWQYGKIFSILIASVCFVFNFWKGVRKDGY